MFMTRNNKGIRWLASFLILCMLLVMVPSQVVFAASTLDASFSSVEVSRFPQIYTYLSVTGSDGSAIKGLTADNFLVTEKSELEDQAVEQKIDVTTIDAADNIAVALAIDRSGSMSTTDMNNAKTAAKSFVENLSAEDRCAIISFASSVTVNQDFTGDKDALNIAIDSLSRTGQTALYDAIYLSVEMTSKEIGVPAVIAFTDGVENYSSHTLDNVINLAKAKGVPVYTIGLGSVNENVLRYIASETGGTYHYTPDSSKLAQIYQELSASIREQYMLVYRTHNAVFDGTTRTIEVTVTVSGNSATGIITYTVPDPLRITLTDDTKELLPVQQPGDKPLTIGAIITSDVGIAEAKLFYRTSGSGAAYNDVSMSKNGDIYSAVIPGSVVNDPGVDFYITATDGTLTASSPESLPAQEPHQIPVIPNEKPVIIHDPVETAELGSDITIKAEISGDPPQGPIDWVELRFRESDMVLYCREPMSLINENIYEATIPGSLVTNVGIDYYIVAADNHGVKGYHGTAENPHRIEVLNDVNDYTVYTVAYIPVKNAEGPAPIQDVSLLKQRAQLAENYYIRESFGQAKIDWEFLSDNWLDLDISGIDVSDGGEILARAIQLVEDQEEGIDLNRYDVVAVIQNIYKGQEFATIDPSIDITKEDFIKDFTPDITSRVILKNNSPYGVYAHELGHSLFGWWDYNQYDTRMVDIINVDSEPFFTSNIFSRGQIRYWGIMGLGTTLNPPPPVTSYNKEQKGWLEYISIREGDVIDITYLIDQADSGEAYRYETGLKNPLYYIFEGRKPGVERNQIEAETFNPIKYKLNDDHGILIYQVENKTRRIRIEGLKTIPFTAPHLYTIPSVSKWLSPNKTVTLTPGETYNCISSKTKFTAVEDGSQLKLETNKMGSFEYAARTTIKLTEKASTVAIPWLKLKDLIKLFDGSNDIFNNGFTFDIDLHVYTADGLKVGMDYETGHYLIEIPGAITSGNIPGAGSEWVSVPDDTEINYIIDTTPALLTMSKAGIKQISTEIIVETITDDENGERTVTEEIKDLELQIAETQVKIVPKTINLKAKNFEVKAFIDIPQDYYFDDTDLETVFLFHGEAYMTANSFRIEDGKIVAGFGLDGLNALLGDSVDEDVTITIKCKHGNTLLTGSDVIKVISPGR